MGRFCDPTPRKSSVSGPGATTAIPLDRYRNDLIVVQQLGDADKHIAAGEITGASAACRGRRATAQCNRYSGNALFAPYAAKSGAGAVVVGRFLSDDASDGADASLAC
jgi:hypothetical protein